MGFPEVILNVAAGSEVEMRKEFIGRQLGMPVVGENIHALFDTHNALQEDGIIHVRVPQKNGVMMTKTNTRFILRMIQVEKSGLNSLAAGMMDSIVIPAVLTMSLRKLRKI